MAHTPRHDRFTGVMTIPVQIRREDVVEDIRELSRVTGKPITDAVGDVVRAALAKRDEERVAQMAEVRAIVARFNAAPTVGPMLTDDDLYDEEGLPK